MMAVSLRERVGPAVVLVCGMGEYQEFILLTVLIGTRLTQHVMLIRLLTWDTFGPNFYIFKGKKYGLIWYVLVYGNPRLSNMVDTTVMPLCSNHSSGITKNDFFHVKIIGKNKSETAIRIYSNSPVVDPGFPFPRQRVASPKEGVPIYYFTNFPWKLCRIEWNKANVLLSFLTASIKKSRALFWSRLLLNSVAFNRQ